jgi:hypothetical protein
MREMKTPTPRPTRNCHYRHCQRHDVNGLRMEVNEPGTGNLIAFNLRFCEAHTPEVWDLIAIRQDIVDSL